MDFIKVLLLLTAVSVFLFMQHHKEDTFKHHINVSEARSKLFDVQVEEDNKIAPESKMERVESVKHVLVSRGVPRESNGEFKSYLPYKAITDRTSEQWKLQQSCWTDSQGFRRYGEYHTVAMGQYYAKFVGQKFVITFETGKQIKVMVGDFKMRQHTNPTMQYVNLPNKNIVEFIVDVRKINELSRKMGSMSYTDGFEGGIIKIEEIVEGK